MTVLSLQWLLARPRRPAAVTAGGTYPDVFFADPVAVEDDSRRMRHGTPPASMIQKRRLFR